MCSVVLTPPVVAAVDVARRGHQDIWIDWRDDRYFHRLLVGDAVFVIGCQRDRSVHVQGLSAYGIRCPNFAIYRQLGADAVSHLPIQSYVTVIAGDGMGHRGRTETFALLGMKMLTLIDLLT